MKKTNQDPSPHHMTPDEFREAGYRVIDWIADYLDEVEEYPVLSQVKPGQIREQLPAQAPSQGESLDAMLRDLEKTLLPGITHWQSPNFFAFFPANSSGPSILGELLSAGLGVQGMLWATSPACTELEAHVLDWLVEMLDLPPHFASSNTGGGVIQDTASSASLCALLAARETITEFESNRSGTPVNLVAYTSNQAHSSVEKAARIAGIGSDHLHLIEVDENFAMSAPALAKAIKKDRERGLLPFFVSTTSGTTSSNAFDPLDEIGPICRENDCWLHVDAAMSGTAALCPQFRHLFQGLEWADSYCFNPHKWMFVNFDCDCFYVKDRSRLIKTLSILPEYLRNAATQSGAVIDYRDWQVPLGRRFRALKLWMVIRHYGIEGLQHHVQEHVRLAGLFQDWVEAHPDLELAAPAPLNLVCFRHRGGDEITQNILNTVNATGRLYLTHTKLNDRLAIRISIGQTHTEERHVRGAWKAILDACPGA